MVGVRDPLESPDRVCAPNAQARAMSIRDPVHPGRCPRRCGNAGARVPVDRRGDRAGRAREPDRAAVPHRPRRPLDGGPDPGHRGGDRVLRTCRCDGEAIECPDAATPGRCPTLPDHRGGESSGPARHPASDLRGVHRGARRARPRGGGRPPDIAQPLRCPPVGIGLIGPADELFRCGVQSPNATLGEPDRRRHPCDDGPHSPRSRRSRS